MFTEDSKSILELFENFVFFRAELRFRYEPILFIEVLYVLFQGFRASDAVFDTFSWTSVFLLIPDPFLIVFFISIATCLGCKAAILFGKCVSLVQSQQWFCMERVMIEIPFL